MPKALVLGVNGQDGSYAAEALLRRGYEVVGAGRQSASVFVGPAATFDYRQIDLNERGALSELLDAHTPDVAFHCAAVHGAAGFCYEPVVEQMWAVNVFAVQTLLEYARTCRSSLRVIYASSAKIFAPPLSGVIDENSAIRPTCLYSIGKIAALELIRYYRRQHGVLAANLILFNHESPRRRAEYFLPTIARGLRRAQTDSAHRFDVKTLDFWMDWSSAEELMDIAVDIIERAPDDDFVLASGKTLHAREMVREWFARHGLDFAHHVRETVPPQHPGPQFHVSLEKLTQRIGRRPVVDIAAITARLTSAESSG